MEDIRTDNVVVRTQGKGSKMKWLSVGLLVVLAIGAFCFFGGLNLFSPADKDTHQAVFLANGQVYFAKLSYSHKWIVLRDVFYLQATDPLQQGEGDGEASATEQQKIGLVKLGGELHGPEDEMFVERNQILFWENMKSDSKVLEAINKYKSDKGENL